MALYKVRVEREHPGVAVGVLATTAAAMGRVNGDLDTLDGLLTAMLGTVTAAGREKNKSNPTTTTTTTTTTNKKNRLVLCEAADYLVSRRVARWGEENGFEVVVVDSPNWLTPMPFFEALVAGKKKPPIMAKFYEAQRKRLGVLLTASGGPVGGKWSFDSENRKKLPASEPVPATTRPSAAARTRGVLDAVRGAVESVARDFPDAVGECSSVPWPVTHEEADAWLDEFLAQRLDKFGEYEDAITTDHDIVFHSALTPALNIGLLDPAEVVRRALDRHRAKPVPINSLEGFLRQVIGWREYIRCVYVTHGVKLRLSNHWGFTREMPASFYTGTTGVAPVDRVIRATLRTGYCHHIERLMVLGCFLMLCRVKPDAVYRWFMELFVDSYDWVMVPNVYGMSQYSSVEHNFATKPYLCGSNYILKMSNESKDAGDWVEVWDALYWTFIADHRAFFRTNPRLAMNASHLDRMDKAKRDRQERVAREFLSKL